MENNLYKGTGTPYLALFDSSESPIIDTLYGLPLGIFVTSFKYQYCEDGCDTGEIVIETANTNISDHPSLQYLMPVILQWGWLYPDGSKKVSPLRSVVVKDHKVEFSPTGVKFTIELSDSSFLLKAEASDYSGAKSDLKKQGDYMNYVEKVLSGTGTNIDVIQFGINADIDNSRSRLQSQLR